jgi:CRISPR-associated protein Cmr5
MSSILTREQVFADGVFKLVSQIGAQSKQARDEYGSMAHKLPVLIRTAGLAQALEFVNTRKKPAQHQLLDDLALVVLHAQGRDALLKLSRKAPLGEYMRLTQEVLQALLWFKRYAQSVLKVADASAGEDGHE